MGVVLLSGSFLSAMLVSSPGGVVFPSLANVGLVDDFGDMSLPRPMLPVAPWCFPFSGRVSALQGVMFSLCPWSEFLASVAYKRRFLIVVVRLSMECSLSGNSSVVSLGSSILGLTSYTSSVGQ